MGDPSLIIPTEDIGIKDRLSYEVMTLLNFRYPSFPAQDNGGRISQNSLEDTIYWESYPHHFECREVTNWSTNTFLVFIYKLACCYCIAFKVFEFNVTCYIISLVRLILFKDGCSKGGDIVKYHKFI